MTGDEQQESSRPSFRSSADGSFASSNLSGRSPLTFFVLVFALFLPFLIFGLATNTYLFPGTPVTVLAAICPAIAAVILVYKTDGTAAVTSLLGRSVDYKQIRPTIWYVPVVLLLPGVVVVRYGLMQLLGLPHSLPQFSVVSTLLFFGVFVIFALGEELGWMGYVIDPMQERWGALRASIFLGVIWAILHIPLHLGHSTLVIALASLHLVGVRVVLVWLYNNTRNSVFAVVVCHAILNVMFTLFPRNSFDAWLIDTLLIAGLALALSLIWDSRTLASTRLPGWMERLGNRQQES